MYNNLYHINTMCSICNGELCPQSSDTSILWVICCMITPASGQLGHLVSIIPIKNNVSIINQLTSIYTGFYNYLHY